MREPCRSCPERALDFGGCRCQAFRLAGDAAEADPACALSPRHDIVLAAREEANRAAPEFVYRGSRLPGAHGRAVESPSKEAAAARETWRAERAASAAGARSEASRPARSEAKPSGDRTSLASEEDQN